MCCVGTDLDGERLMRREEVLYLCGISRSTLDTMVRTGRFPRPVRTNNRAVGWRVKDVLIWLASRPPATGANWR